MKNSTLSGFWWLLLVGAVSLLLCAPFFRVVYNLPDEGIFLRGAELILHGKRLYADFFGFVAPGGYLLTAAWFSIAGISFESARILVILTIIGIACFTFLACRLVSKSAPLSAILPIGWVMMTQWHWMQVSHHWFTTFFSMVAVWAALASLDQPEPRSLRWPLIAGLAAGAATMITQTRGAWVALAVLSAFFSLRKNRSELIAYALAGILMFAGVIAYLAEQGTLAAAFAGIIGFGLTRYASIQYLPYGYSVSVFDWPLKYVFPLAALLLLLVIIRDGRASLHDKRLRLCAAFALAGFLGCFPRPDITHIGFAAPLALPLIALCAVELTQQIRPAIRYAIGASILIGLCGPSAVAFASFARVVHRTPVVLTPRGEAALRLPDFSGMAELLPVIAATPSQDGFLFYPHMPLMSFLAAREHVSRYDVILPWYTTPAQYQEACLSAVRHASWVVTDRRSADYGYWKEIYPSMPDTKPLETIRFEESLDHAFELVVTKGFFELRRRRTGTSDAVCDAISARGPEDKE
jgi:hypothetical protein